MTDASRSTTPGWSFSIAIFRAATAIAYINLPPPALERVNRASGPGEFTMDTISPSFNPDCAAVCGATSLARFKAAPYALALQLFVVGNRPINPLNLICTRSYRYVHKFLRFHAFEWISHC